MCLFQKADLSMSSGSSENPAAKRAGTPHRVRVIIFRVVAVLAGLFFVVAVVLMASAPWVLLQPDQQTRTELNRWFLTVAGSVDAIAAGVLLALALQPRRTLLIVEHAVAAIVAGVLILPFQPSFAAILAIGVVPLIAYPYWREVRTFRSWWVGVSRSVLILAVLAGAALLVTAAIAFPRQIGGTDPAARGGLVVGLRRARHRARTGWGARRQPRSRLPHPERFVQRGLAISRIGGRAGSSAPPRIVGSHRRRGCSSGRRRFLRCGLARL
jgi:hypothetical protein